MENQHLGVRSSFVTVIAWIFIALSGFTLLSSLVQLVLFTFVPQSAHMQQSMQAMLHAPNQMPSLTYFMTVHLRLFNVLFLLESSAMLIISIALLKRKNWGRNALIAFLIIGIVWELINLMMKVSFLRHMPPLPDNMPVQFRSIQETALIFSSILAAILSLFFAWVIKRLLSEKIKAEFVG